MVLISAVIISKDRVDSLNRLLISLKNQNFSLSNIEIIIVDDNSKIPYSFKGKNMKIIRNPTCLKAPLSRNIGIKASKGKYILILDDDVILSSNFISDSLKILLSNPKIGAVVPKKIDCLINKHKKHYNEYSCSRPTFYSGDLRNFKEKRGYVQYGSMCYLTHKYILEKVGYYDPIYGLNKGHSYREESDIHAKIREYGFYIFFEPKVIITHNIIYLGGQNQFMGDKLFWFAHNHLVFLKKHDPHYILRSVGYILDLFGYCILYGLKNIPYVIKGYICGLKTMRSIN